MPMLEQAPHLGGKSRNRVEPGGVPAEPTLADDGRGAVAARTLIWRLETGGWTEREAGNLVALFHGLRPAISGWSEREIEHLRFLRALVESGRLTG
jgi:hypothetical protein